MAFEDVINRFRNLRPDRIISDLIRANSPFIEDQQRGQLLEGKDAGGQEIQPEYKPITKRIKARKGQPTDRVTLKDTGKFHKATKAIILSDRFELDSLDSKRTKLTEKYGEEIFGLTDQNIVILREKLKEPIAEILRKEILR
jgi:hypothetical protein